MDRALAPKQAFASGSHRLATDRRKAICVRRDRGGRQLPLQCWFRSPSFMCMHRFLLVYRVPATLRIPTAESLNLGCFVYDSYPGVGILRIPHECVVVFQLLLMQPLCCRSLRGSPSFAMGNSAAI
eukprot:2086634-Rhodomonas_salina.2